MARLLSLSLVLIALGQFSVAWITPIDLVVENKKISPDGFSTPRSAVLVNGTLPGPIITGYKGDTLLINVKDRLHDSNMYQSTSVHWHGIHMKHLNQFDGAASVTQCPIVPGHSFQYNVTIPDQSGTYWYHSHLGTQYCDGLRGALIIKDPEDPHIGLYDVDDESTVISMSDWYHAFSKDVVTQNASETPDSTLINGLGRYNNSNSPLSVVRAQPGKRHRYRLINMGCNPSYRFSIDGHNLTIIETDGIATDPLTVNQLEIFPGQRYSVVVDANKNTDNYWIRAAAVNFDGTLLPANLTGFAILRYDGANATEPTTQPPKSYNVMNEADLHPTVNPGAPSKTYGPPDINITLTAGFDDTKNKWFLNNDSFCGPQMPILLQILSGYTPLQPSTTIISLPRNKTVQVSIPASIPDGTADYHPFHLHGHSFDVVRVAGSQTYNYDNPVRRDVINTGLYKNGDNVTFQFRTDNPGPWYLHCHIDWHLEGGMAIVFAEDTSDASRTVPNSAWKKLCPLWTEKNPDTQLPSGGGCA